MMNTQAYPNSRRHGGTTREILLGGQAVTVEYWPGEYTVVDGRVWLTRRCDPKDHVLGRGDVFVASKGDVAVVEAWPARALATLRWRALPQPGRGLRLVRVAAGAAGAAGLRGLGVVAALAALALRRAEAPLAALAAWARSAASNASRAQGRIAGGESIASCGALK